MECMGQGMEGGREAMGRSGLAAWVGASSVGGVGCVKECVWMVKGDGCR